MDAIVAGGGGGGGSCLSDLGCIYGTLGMLDIKIEFDVAHHTYLFYYVLKAVVEEED